MVFKMNVIWVNLAKNSKNQTIFKGTTTYVPRGVVSVVKQLYSVMEPVYRTIPSWTRLFLGVNSFADRWTGPPDWGLIMELTTPYNNRAS